MKGNIYAKTYYTRCCIAHRIQCALPYYGIIPVFSSDRDWRLHSGLYCCQHINLCWNCTRYFASSHFSSRINRRNRITTQKKLGSDSYNYSQLSGSDQYSLWNSDRNLFFMGSATGGYRKDFQTRCDCTLVMILLTLHYRKCPV